MLSSVCDLIYFSFRLNLIVHNNVAKQYIYIFGVQVKINIIPSVDVNGVKHVAYNANLFGKP